MNKIYLLLVLSLTCCLSVIGQTKTFIDQPYIEVSGHSDTLVTPNLIYIKIVIAEKDSREKISLEEQEKQMITTFQKLKINTEFDLTTSDILSSYKFYLLRQKNIFKTKEYILKVRTADEASAVFIQLEDLGISNTSIFKVDYSDIENLKNLCKIKAIENSHKEAIALTKPLLQSVGNAIYITDNETNIDNQLQGSVYGLQIRGYSTIDKAKYEAPRIEFEKIKVSASISVKYILK